MQTIDIIFSIGILLLSVVVHELSHGYAAEMLGDPTARYAGRLTLNPLKHLDLFGSIIVPITLAILPPHIVIGWAKPVPYNPYNLRNQRFGETIVAAAGPAANLFIAIFFGTLIKVGLAYSVFPLSFLSVASLIVLINLVLFVFNLVPIPPLDGSKILFGFLPQRFLNVKEWLERYSFILIIVFIFFLWQFILPVVGFLFTLLTGAHL